MVDRRSKSPLCSDQRQGNQQERQYPDQRPHRLVEYTSIKSEKEEGARRRYEMPESQGLGWLFARFAERPALRGTLSSIQGGPFHCSIGQVDTQMGDPRLRIKCNSRAHMLSGKEYCKDTMQVCNRTTGGRDRTISVHDFSLSSKQFYGLWNSAVTRYIIAHM